MPETTITTEGGLLPSDVLDAVAAEELPGQQAADFGLARDVRLNDEIAAAWGDVRVFWDAFQRRLQRQKSGDSITSVTRESWVLPLLEILGFRDITYMRNAIEINERTFPISHRAGTDEEALPLHIEGAQTDLDTRLPTGRPRLSPHALMQDYLNSTEHLWALVTNGERIRLLRDTSRMSRPSYVEFHLSVILETEQFSDFALLYRLLHRSRFPIEPADAPNCWLEQYYQQAIVQGGRVREGLRDGVERALIELGNGFLQHFRNQQLRDRIHSASLSPLSYYRQLLRLVYRLLFLMVAEDRHLIAASPEQADVLSMLHYRPQKDEHESIYEAHYSVSRLRRMADYHTTGRGPYDDFWIGMKTTFSMLEGDDEVSARGLGLAPLNGDLFGPEALRDLEPLQLRNKHFLAAIRSLSLYQDPESKLLRRVNYAALDVEELGSVYESLLDYRPVFIPTGHGHIDFDLVSGTERKTTGSYYTRPELVKELIISALDPLIDARLQAPPHAREEALLSITVCDPACGSGHFLLEAARRIGRELARVRSGEDQPSPMQFRWAVREVIARCIYGVDLNPLAVDLCKLALWIEGHNAGMPLSFLDSHIRLGNSLIGATADLVADGIPDDAFKPVTGDDKKIATTLRKRNKQERELHAEHGMAQDDMFAAAGALPTADLAAGLRAMEQIPDHHVGTIRAKTSQYKQLRQQAQAQFVLYDLWTAAFFQPLTSGQPHITTRLLLDHQQTPLPADHLAVLLAQGLAYEPELRFFHWELEFPQVFTQGAGMHGDGFDVVLGNPPWEMLQLDAREFFIGKEQHIVDAANMAARNRLIEKLAIEKPERYTEYQSAKQRTDSIQRFVHSSGRFPLTSYGRINLMALFSEMARGLINAQGRAGVIVPTGIATDSFNQYFFADLNQQQQLVSLYDFENREKLFAEVDSRYRFSLLTLGATSTPTRFVFFASNINHLQEEQRGFTLTPEEIGLINPNTRTSPTFRTKADAELTKKIYRRVPVLVNEQTEQNPWGFKGMLMFMMNTDSHLFHTKPGDGLLPLYEGKLLHQFNHRWATYQGKDSRDLTPEELADPDCSITPRYWVERAHVDARLAGKWERAWLLGWRDVCRSTDERTVLASLFPKAGAGDTFLLMLPLVDQAHLVCCLLATLNSLTFDFVARQKVGGVHLKYFTMKQLPVLPPDTFTDTDIASIVPRVLELVYTAWDMAPFAQDVLSELQAQQRSDVLAAIAQRNAASQALRPTPITADAAQAAVGLLPFAWDEERRAVVRAELDAHIARLYGLTREELRYILDPADIHGADFPGETFRVLKEKELRRYGEYRTQRLVLAAF
ncbi:MAG: N-6 DNA methylase [Chloroflexaceae bacterium]|nr:N-6 DNA methylase [Chloroflexaceae bacterium]